MTHSFFIFRAFSWSRKESCCTGIGRCGGGAAEEEDASLLLLLLLLMIFFWFSE
jgi:hypothetical protein